MNQLAVFLAAISLLGQADRDQANANDTAKAWQQYYSKIAGQYSLSLDNAGEDHALMLRDKPVLDWTSIEDYNGAVGSTSDSITTWSTSFRTTASTSAKCTRGICLTRTVPNCTFHRIDSPVA